MTSLRALPPVLLFAACSPAKQDTSADTSLDTSDTGCASCDTGATAPSLALYINEFQANNTTTIADDSGAYPDWIELYSALDVPLDLSGYSMSDDLDDPLKHVLGALTISPGGFLLLWADADTEQGETHLGFSLAADGEEIGLYDPEGHPIDRLVYEAQAADGSAARTPDGAETWGWTLAPTPGASNAGSE